MFGVAVLGLCAQMVLVSGFSLLVENSIGSRKLFGKMIERIKKNGGYDGGSLVIRAPSQRVTR